ncbi:acyl-CoA/acyl-ACP dehydrogenase [Gordonia terrae]|uniref:acyl-CoA dehydrogenase family protein n=1 Tax=Gordonia terrae TaxID=2055 RepID=UPI00200B3B48|nr:acyl-CoA dehydrogenase family protein [Gordonia terrae]UPW08606.1 acyl-CoA/acyl-ACP dehydrogenase [Gordonia terrae]
MITGWSEEHDELRRVVRRFLAAKSPSESVRSLAEAGATDDPSVWRQMAEQLGLQGISIPEEHGGAGMGPVELGIVMEEMGRALYVGPFFSTVVLAGQTLAACEDGASRARWLPQIVAGQLTATVAVSDHDLTFDTSTITTQATAATTAGVAPEWTVSGTKRFVIDGATADLVLVAARVDEGLGLFAVDGSEAGVRREPIATVDTTRAVAELTFDDAPAIRLDVDVERLLSRAGDLAAAALAAEQIGGASAALQMAVDYAAIRVQFERPIGSFQAIKHRCADLMVQIESGRSAAFFAAALLADDDPEGPVAASVAAAWCSDAYAKAAKENIQFHGGIGYTWECDAHLYLRRATASEVVLGASRAHRARIADLVGM